MSISDNYDLWEQRDREQHRRLARFPKCTRCGEHIQQEDAVCIDGNYYCDNCLKELREWIEVDE